MESSIIIEHLGVRHPWPLRLIPDDAHVAAEVRMMDVFDNYVSTPMQRIVVDSTSAAENRDGQGVAEVRRVLDTAYRWIDDAMTGREGAAGDAFSLADCAAAPALFYADWAHPIGEAFASLRALSPAAPRATLARPGGRRSTTVPPTLSARGTRPRLTRGTGPARPT